MSNNTQICGNCKHIGRDAFGARVCLKWPTKSGHKALAISHKLGNVPCRHWRCREGNLFEEATT